MQVCGPLLLLEQLSITLCLIVRLAERPYFYILSKCEFSLQFTVIKVLMSWDYNVSNCGQLFTHESLSGKFRVMKMYLALLNPILNMALADCMKTFSFRHQCSVWF